MIDDYLCMRIRDVAQLVAHTSGGREVASSSLVIPTEQMQRGLIINPFCFVGGKEVGENSAKFYSYYKILFNRAFHSKFRNAKKKFFFKK